MDEFLKRFGDYAVHQGEAWRLQHPELMDSYQAACEKFNQQYIIGPLTMEYVFVRNNMVNMYDLQRVLDCVEIELDRKMLEPKGIYNLGVEDAAKKVDEVFKSRNIVDTICTLLKTGDDVPEFVKVVPVPDAIKAQAEKEELLVNLFPYADDTPPICGTKSALEDVRLAELETGPINAAPVDPSTLDWHYVECKTTPNGKAICGWFPTRELAYMHRDFWPQHIKDFTFVKPMLIVDPGMALYFPEQAGSDVLRKTNDFLVTCGVAKVGLGERYFPEPLNDLGNNALMQKDMDALCAAHDNGQVAEAVAHFRGALPYMGGRMWEFKMGDRVRKHSGSWWEGKVVGFYSTEQTPRGYAVQVQTRNNNGPVQIYPEGALEHHP